MKIVLFDRDGTLIVDPEDERVDSEDEIVLFPDTLNALRLLDENNYSVAIITNQAGIGEGRYDLARFWEIENTVMDILKLSGINILNTQVCPHSADDHCDCRKPKTKLIHEALSDLGVNAHDVFMVGDRESDILAGKNAGTKTILVQTGNTVVSESSADYISPNLLDAANYIINH